MGESTDTAGCGHALVLLATYNGRRFIEEQLSSLAGQDVGRLDIRVSDDGSTDGTLAVLERWKEAWTSGSFEISHGPRRGFAENFRALASRVDTDAGYVAFCDQDDIWAPDKVSAAIAALAPHDAGRPAVYFSRTRLVDAEGRPYGLSPLFTRRPAFRNALVQSIGGGNTMVLNAKGFSLFAESARRTSFVAHDWWGYIIVSGAGGHVYYDPEPRIDYRQHGANCVGSNRGFRARLRRLGMQSSGVFARWNSTNVDALWRCFDLLSPESQQTLAEFAALRRTRAVAGLRRLWRSGIRRQTVKGNIALAIAVALGMT